MGAGGAACLRSNLGYRDRVGLLNQVEEASIRDAGKCRDRAACEGRSSVHRVIPLLLSFPMVYVLSHGIGVNQ